MMNDAALVVLHFNKPNLTVRCLGSLLSAGYAPDRIHCFDNGSSPDVSATLRKQFPLVRHRGIPDNRGYSGGFNAALQGVFAEGFGSAMFLTNDTLALPNAAEACEEIADRFGAGLVAPRISYLSRPGEIDSIGGFFDDERAALGHYRDENLPPLLGENDYVPGTALWVRREAFEALGGAEESYHTYWEDADLCFRARRAGIPLARAAQARVLHGVGQTCHKKPLYTAYYYQRNRLRFCRRFLTGPAREAALAHIRNDFETLATRWKENNDNRRLKYADLLLQELSEEAMETGGPKAAVSS